MRHFHIRLLLVLIVLFATPSIAREYSFSWAANASVDGYKLYYKKDGSPAPPFDGKDAKEGESPIDVKDATSFNISGLEDNATYHFALTSYDSVEESDFTDVITVYPQAGQTDNKKNEAVSLIISWFLRNSNK